jgi:hypothetical protein
MDWLLSPVGMIAILVLIVLIASLVYWKREPLKRWLRRQEISGVEVSAGPVKVTLKGKEEPKAAPKQAGVSFGEGNDFTGARISGVAGRDIRRGAASAKSPGGEVPGVDFGKKGKFGDVDIEDVAGRDVVED